MDFLMSSGSVLPGCMSVARWLFKTCAAALEQTGWSKPPLAPRPGDAEAAFMASSQRGQVLFFLDLLRGALEGNSNRTIYCSWGRGLHVKERMKPLWLAARAEWWVRRSGGGGPMKSSVTDSPAQKPGRNAFWLWALSGGGPSTLRHQSCVSGTQTSVRPARAPPQS